MLASRDHSMKLSTGPGEVSTPRNATATKIIAAHESREKGAARGRRGLGDQPDDRHPDEEDAEERGRVRTDGGPARA